ncbi:MAG: protein glxC [Pseudomonadales bacterium]
MKTYDLAQQSVRELNQALHELPKNGDEAFAVLNPNGMHAVACGIDAPAIVTIQGHAGYYCAGMHQKGKVTVEGNVGVGVAENMMSGEVHVKGNASQSAGATAHGGLLVIDGDASARCGISLKGADIVVKGNIGHMSCFMAQAGRVVACGDAGEALGDSLYEARIYVKGEVKSLGADCVEKEMRAEHVAELQALLDSAGVVDDPQNFKRYGSARQLYEFKVDDAVL